MKVLDYDTNVKDLLFLLDHLKDKDLEIEMLKEKLAQSEHEKVRSKERYMALLEKLA